MSLEGQSQQLRMPGHLHYFEKLKEFTRSMPNSDQSHMTEDLLENLAKSLMDDTVFLIVNELKEIQHMTEISLCDERRGIVEQRLIQRSQCYDFKSLQKFDEKTQEILRDKDLQIIAEIDKLVEQQQAVLEKAGIPGFFVTNDSGQQKIQMHLLQYIAELAHDRH